MRTVYKPKMLVSGYKLNLQKAAQYVAVPDKLVSKSDVQVVYNGTTMIIDSSCEKIKSMTFDDKYGRGRYTLDYYEWKPNNSLFGIS